MSLNYSGKVILAPMVKIGNLPTRLLALRYGADLVYTEEIIDFKFLKSRRVFNDVTNAVEYLDDYDNMVFFQTCEEEKSRVILQIGTSDPLRALKVAQMVQDDVSGIDINMGCPKEFSIKGGMGAALLKDPLKIQSILTTLVSNIKIPITCKIRILNSLEDTLKLCKLIEECGVAAIGVHGRTQWERPRHENRNHYIQTIAQTLKIPVIANGGSKEIRNFDDIEKFRLATGSSSVMIARAAEHNLSIFSKDGKLEDVHIVITKFLKLAQEYNLSFTIAKYTVQNMLKEQQESELGKKFLATQTLEEICLLWDVYPNKNLKRNGISPQNNEIDSKKQKTQIFEICEEDGVLIVPNCIYIRGHYAQITELPKSLLVDKCRKEKYQMPTYVTDGRDKKFRSVLTFAGKKFRTDLWEKNKKCAEQAAAIACLRFLSLQNENS